MSDTKPRAAIYARYSTDKQDPSSIEDQVRVCRRLCDQKGFVVADVYSDGAKSGTTIARSDLKRMLADVGARTFDVLVVESLSRLSRDWVDLPLLYRELEYRGIRIVGVDCDDVNPMHVAMHGMVSTLGIQATSRETFRKHESEVLRGRIMGGLGYGYQPVRAFGADGKPITGQREIVPVEADVVRRIFREYAEGKSAKAIAAGLNRDGIPGPRGGPWKQNTINGNRKRGTGILNNRNYIGTYIWNRQKFKTKPVGLHDLASMSVGSGRPRTACPNDESAYVRIEHPELVIVPRELWDAVKARQKALDCKIESQRVKSGGQGRRSGIGAARRSLTVLAGRIFCGSCGGTVTASGGRYVRCCTAAETGGSTCSHTKNHRRDRIEAQVFDGLAPALQSPEILELFRAAYLKEIAAANKVLANQHSGFGEELGRVEQEIGNLVEAIGRGFTNPSVKAKLDGLEARRAEIEAERRIPAPDALTAHPEAETLWQAKIQTLSANIKDGPDGETLREAFRGLVERVTLSPDPAAEHGFSVEVEGVLRSC